MQPTSAVGQNQAAQNTRLLTLLLILPLLLSLASTWSLDHTRSHKPLFSVTNMVGPSTQSLLSGHGLTVCTEDMGTQGNPICFHAARMPINALTVALGIKLLGDRYLWVAFFKTLLLLLPIELSIYLVWRRLPHSRWPNLTILLLIAPFAIPAFLADVSNLLVDEGYSYSFLTAAAAILFFGHSTKHPLTRTLLFALALDGLYLSKSSMLPAVIVLLLGFLLLETRTPLRVLTLTLVAAALLGWAAYQHHASGRYTLGTSLDGINLHKGNNPAFLQNYPPPPGDSLDWYDFELNRNLHFTNEWSFNDYHQQAALAYIRAHPQQTLQADTRKLRIFFLSIQKYGSTNSYGLRKLWEEAGMIVFRLILWTALICAVALLFRPSPLRLTSGIFLALTAACALPYVAGFAYTRHVSVLIYPSALFCCHLLCEPNSRFAQADVLTG